MFVKGDNKGKDFQKLMSTLMNVYTGMTPTPSTSKTTNQPSTTQKAELANQPIEKKPKVDKDPGAQQIEEVIMQVLKKGTDVKKFGKFCGKTTRQSVKTKVNNLKTQCHLQTLFWNIT